MKKLLLAVALSALSSQSWAVLFTSQTCSNTNLTVNGGVNPTACEGFILESGPGGANDDETVMNNTPIFESADVGAAILFTGFFYTELGVAQGSDYWDFAQKYDAGSGTGGGNTVIDLGLDITDDGMTATWDITDGILGTYEAALAVIKSAAGFDAYLISDSLGDVTGGSFNSTQDIGGGTFREWSHFALYVGGDGTVPPDPGVPAPGSLPLLVLGLALLSLGRSVRSRA